jgi:hypothetical protein
MTTSRDVSEIDFNYLSDGALTFYLRKLFATFRISGNLFR